MLYFVAVVFLLCAAVLFYICYVCFKKSLQNKKWLKHQAYVTDIEYVNNRESVEGAVSDTDLYILHYQYTINQQIFVGKSSYAASGFKNKLHQPIKIVINPNNLSMSDVDQSFTHILPWILLVMAFSFFAFGVDVFFNVVASS